MNKKEEILADLVRAYKNGYSPTREEFVKRGSTTRRDIDKHWGNFGSLKQAAQNIISDTLQGMDEKSAVEISQDTSQYHSGFEAPNNTLTANDVETLEDLLEFSNVDLEKWEVKNYSVSAYSGKTSVKADFKSREKENDLNEIYENLLTDLASHSPVVPSYSYFFSGEPLLLEVALFDVHLGKALFSPDPERLGIEVAKESFKNAVIELTNRALKFGSFSRIVFPIGNDYLTADSSKNVTYSGTCQDTDLSFPRVFREGRKLLVWAIDYLKQIAPVDVVYVVSNHDTDSMFQMADAIECWYRNDENVTIDSSENFRKYYRWGDCCIFFHHGDKVKAEKLISIACSEYKDWSACKHKELHLGHFHHESVKDESGCVIRIIPSLTKPDRYHEGHAFVGSKQRAQAFVWGKENGLNTILYSTSAN